MKDKMEISVCNKYTHKYLKSIYRVPFSKGMCGNFNPHWVRYKYKEYLLHGGIDSAYIQEWDGKGYIEIDYKGE